EEGEDLPGPEPDEGMEEDHYNLDPPIFPGPDQELLPEEENMDLEAGGEAEVAPPDLDGDQPMDYQPAGPSGERAGQNEALERYRPNTRSQARANQRRVTFQLDPPTDQEFESACIRMPDGTIDMEPTNLEQEGRQIPCLC
ncbi:MAG: hypothetical protein GY696_32555, partial [Gammaproteobacteria bacterium]|nr:hypothetical protein [Gammaproteobacteria bacterium]